MTEVRRFLDRAGIKPWDVTRSTVARLMRLNDRCLAEKYFGRNMREFHEMVRQSYDKSHIA